MVGFHSLAFKLEFKRNYDPDQTARRNTVLRLGEVNDGVVVDVINNGRPSEDTTAHDALEKVALESMFLRQVRPLEIRRFATR